MQYPQSHYSSQQNYLQTSNIRQMPSPQRAQRLQSPSNLLLRSPTNQVYLQSIQTQNIHNSSPYRSNSSQRSTQIKSYYQQQINQQQPYINPADDLKNSQEYVSNLQLRVDMLINKTRQSIQEKTSQVLGSLEVKRQQEFTQIQHSSNKEDLINTNGLLQETDQIKNQLKSIYSDLQKSIENRHKQIKEIQQSTKTTNFDVIQEEEIIQNQPDDQNQLIENLNYINKKHSIDIFAFIEQLAQVESSKIQDVVTRFFHLKNESSIQLTNSCEKIKKVLVIGDIQQSHNSSDNCVQFEEQEDHHVDIESLQKNMLRIKAQQLLSNIYQNVKKRI